MTRTELKKKVLQYKWEWWAERPFGAFIMSLFKDGETRRSMKRWGVDAQWPAMLFQKGAFYKSIAVWDSFAEQIERYVDGGGSVFAISHSCERYRINGLRAIERLNKSSLAPIERFARLYEVLTFDISFVWITHGLEHVYKRRLLREVPRHVRTDQAEQYIGDISYPVKQNAHHYLERALRGTRSLGSIQKEFGWIKVRDWFSEGFTLTELKRERVHLRSVKSQPYRHPKVPRPLRQLAAISQELVYLRTLRTDVLFELMWRARPILRAVARKYRIPFSSLRDYAAQDLIAGTPRQYPRLMTCVSFGPHFAFFDKPILNDRYDAHSSLNGVTANSGIARGVAKIVRTAHEIGKVNSGDILIAPTTAPSYIIGMKKAAAFVTDEGGITSHAAIVSREMHKPCVIGTKIATKVFKDGDRVEVDATRGVVRKL